MAQAVRARHRLRFHVTSSDFADLERNFNTGGVNSQEARGQVAANTIFQDGMRPSHLVLPRVQY